MKLKYTLLSILMYLFSIQAKAQIENVIVETYYVSDANDVTDTVGGFLEAGSKTYRIYIDMAPGCKLTKIYGDANHALKFASTSVFFNNKIDGQSFGKEFSKNRLQENTVALDSWLTLGQTTRAAAKTYFGVLKSEDRDGSFIGGTNNDEGLLMNIDPSAGIPLTTKDGMDTMTVIPQNWADDGIVSSGVDSTIFGSVIADSQFVSYHAWLQNDGVSGINPDTNRVLVAQLTTRGELSFELNVEIEVPGINHPVQCVARLASGEVNSDTLMLSPYLKYPSSCGCTDPQYLEYSPAYVCNNSDSCRTHIVFGCMDSLACNFDPEANYNIPVLCCYPGYCNDRDISVVCPALNVSQSRLFPNPVKNEMTLEISVKEQKEIRYEIYDSFGKMVQEKNTQIPSGSSFLHVDVSGFIEGVYLLRLFKDGNPEVKTFIKN